METSPLRLGLLLGTSIEADIEDHGDDEGPLANELLEHIELVEVDEINEALKIIDNTALKTHLRRDKSQRFQMEQDAERYAEYVAMGWREPEAQDIGKVVFNRAFKRTEGNLIKVREILRNSYPSGLQTRRRARGR